MEGSRSSPKASLTFDLSEEDNGALLPFFVEGHVRVSERGNKLSDALRVK